MTSTYRLDLVENSDPDNILACQWDNVSVPIERELSIPNPFTGYSDVFMALDSGDFLSTPRPDPTLIPISNGELHSGELKMVLTEFFDGEVHRTLPFWGDEYDAFRYGTSRDRLSIGTNPAPVSIYTYRSNSNFGAPNTSYVPPPAGDAPAPFENRTIWLNGLSVKIVDQMLLDGGAGGATHTKIEIRWDRRVDDDMRWTGNIVLRNDDDVLTPDPLNRQNKVILGQGTTLFLDRDCVTHTRRGQCRLRGR